VKDSQISLAIGVLSIIAGSSVLVAYIKNSQLNRRKHKELVAEASKSVLKRVEMYYRIRRRTKDPADIISIRNTFHGIQEENEYFKTLLKSESKWHGNRYEMYINAIQKLTGDHIRQAWIQKPFGPDAEIKSNHRPDHQKIDLLSAQFALDCRRVINPVSRIWMRIRDSFLVTKLWRVRAYDLREL
jgi:hypothetical protein